MIVGEILTMYDAETLAKETDGRLHLAQTILNTFKGHLIQHYATTDRLFRVYGYEPNVTTDMVTTVNDFITQTLNTRYGCND